MGWAQTFVVAPARRRVCGGRRVGGRGVRRASLWRSRTRRASRATVWRAEEGSGQSPDNDEPDSFEVSEIERVLEKLTGVQVDFQGLPGRLSPRYSEEGLGKPLDVTPFLQIPPAGPTPEDSEYHQKAFDYFQELANARRIRPTLVIAIVAVLLGIFRKQLVATYRACTLQNFYTVARLALSADLYFGAAIYGAVPLVLLLWAVCTKPLLTDAPRRLMVCYFAALSILPLPYMIMVAGPRGIPLGALTLIIFRFVLVQSIWLWRELHLELALHRQLLLHRAISFWKYPLGIFSAAGSFLYSVTLSYYVVEPGKPLHALSQPVASHVKEMIQNSKRKLPTTLKRVIESHLYAYTLILTTTIILACLVAWFSYTLDLGRDRSGRNDGTWMERLLVSKGFFSPSITKGMYDFSELLSYRERSPNKMLDENGFALNPLVGSWDEHPLRDSFERERMRIGDKNLAVRSEWLSRRYSESSERSRICIENWNLDPTKEFDMDSYDMFNYDADKMEVGDDGSIFEKGLPQEPYDRDDDISELVASVKDLIDDADLPQAAVKSLKSLADDALGPSRPDSYKDGKLIVESWTADDDEISEMPSLSWSDQLGEEAGTSEVQASDIDTTEEEAFEQADLKVVATGDEVAREARVRDLNPDTDFQEMWESALDQLQEFDPLT